MDHILTSRSAHDDESFFLCGRYVTQGGMKPLTIIEDLDVGEQHLAYLIDICEDFAVEQLGLDGTDGGLGDSVIPTITFSAHADRHAKLAEALLVIVCSIRGATISMVYEAARGWAIGDG